MEAATPAPPPPPPPPPPAGGTSAYPVNFTAEHQAQYHRFLPLVKWLLAIPHYIVLFFLGIGAIFVILISFFAVLITGRYPEGMWTTWSGVLRWGMPGLRLRVLARRRVPAVQRSRTIRRTRSRLTAEYPEHVSAGGRSCTGCW